MKTTQSQRAIMESITEGLRNREVVCMWGNQPNGKSHVFYNLVSSLSGFERSAFSQERKPERFTIDILPGIEPPSRGNADSFKVMQRQILESYGVPIRRTKRYSSLIDLLIQLREARIMPTLALDGVEILPEKGFVLYQKLNELRDHRTGERIGPAALLSGNFNKRRMPPNFWKHIKDVQVRRVSQAEIAEFISYLDPQYRDSFTPQALKKLADCSSTLEMSRIARNAIEYWQKHSRSEKIDVPIVTAVTDKLLHAKQRIAA